MDGTAWEAASRKYVREYGDLLAQAISGSSLVGTERDLLRGILRVSPVVVYLHGGVEHPSIPANAPKPGQASPGAMPPMVTGTVTGAHDGSFTMDTQTPPGGHQALWTL